jgi:hypothetical protein
LTLEEMLLSSVAAGFSYIPTSAWGPPNVPVMAVMLSVYEYRSQAKYQNPC